MAALELVERYRYEDYKKWEGRWELIDGIAYTMAPAPYPIHQRVVLDVAKELRDNLECKECEVFISPVDWIVDEENVVQPDVAIFCEEYEERAYFTKTPPLIVEVLSLSTALKDATVKFHLYERSGVKYYVMINPRIKEYEIFELVDGKYQPQVKNKKEPFTFVWDGCSATIDFKKVLR